MKSLVEKHKIIIVTVAVLIVLLTLLVPPFFGKSDDGSFFPVLSQNGLYNTGDSVGVFCAKYGVLKDFDGGNFIPVLAAKAASSVFSKDIFDIRFLALIYLPAFLTGLYLIISSIKLINKKAQIAVCIFAAIVLCDIGYISYFNSFYLDALYLAACVLLFGSIMFMSFRENISVPALVFALLSAAILSSAGSFGTAVAVLTGILFFIIGFWDKSGLKKPFAVATSLLIVAVSLSVLSVAPPIKGDDIDRYNALYNGALTGSNDIKGELAFFGIPEKYVSLADKTYYEAADKYDLTSEEVKEELFSKITPSKTVAFYISHPLRFYKVFDKAVKNAPFLSQSYISTKTDKNYGIKKAPALWSWAHRFLTPGSLLVLLVFFIIVIVVSAINMKKNAFLAKTAIFTVLTACVLLAEPVITGGLASISRRLILFQFALDMLVIMCIIWAVNTYTQRKAKLRENYGVNQ